MYFMLVVTALLSQPFYSQQQNNHLKCSKTECLAFQMVNQILREKLHQTQNIQILTSFMTMGTDQLPCLWQALALLYTKMPTYKNDSGFGRCVWNEWYPDKFTRYFTKHSEFDKTILSAF